MTITSIVRIFHIRHLQRTQTARKRRGADISSNPHIVRTCFSTMLAVCMRIIGASEIQPIVRERVCRSTVGHKVCPFYGVFVMLSKNLRFVFRAHLNHERILYPILARVNRNRKVARLLTSKKSLFGLDPGPLVGRTTLTRLTPAPALAPCISI